MFVCSQHSTSESACEVSLHPTHYETQNVNLIKLVIKFKDAILCFCESCIWFCNVSYDFFHLIKLCIVLKLVLLLRQFKSAGLRLTLITMRLSKLQSMTSLRELGSADLRKRFFPVHSTPSSACACLSSFLCCFLSLRFCLYINKWQLKLILNERLSAGAAGNSRLNRFT